MDDLQPPHAIEKGSRTSSEDLRSYPSDRYVPFAVGGAIGGSLILYGWEFTKGALVLLATAAAWFAYEAIRKWQRRRLRARLRAQMDA